MINYQFIGMLIKSPTSASLILLLYIYNVTSKLLPNYILHVQIHFVQIVIKNKCLPYNSSSDKTVKVWDTTSRQCEHTFKDHSDQVSNTILIKFIREQPTLSSLSLYYIVL